jgi:hypothetical protein
MPHGYYTESEGTLREHMGLVLHQLTRWTQTVPFRRIFHLAKERAPP